MRQNLVLDSHSVNVEWYTPPELVKLIGESFDLDPCAPADPAKRTVPARRYLTREDDGIASPWAADEFVFMNPPYERGYVEAFMNKLSRHEAGGIALVFARTDTGWFQANPPDLLLAIRGRISFINGETMQKGSSGGAPSLLLGYGLRAEQALAACSVPGHRFRLV